MWVVASATRSPSVASSITTSAVPDCWAKNSVWPLNETPAWLMILVHRPGHHGGKLAAHVAVAGALQGSQHVGAVALVEHARHHGGAEGNRTDGEGTRPLRVGRLVGIIGLQLDGQPQQGGPLAQQRRIGDHHQLVRPILLGNLQHQIRADPGRFTWGDGETTTTHQLPAPSIWM